MKFYKYLIITILSSLFFMQCSSSQKLEEKPSFKTESAYFQSWVAGVRDGGSGINVFIPITSELKNLKLDSLYFREQKVALTTKPYKPNLYIGRIFTIGNQKKNYKLKTIKMPFDLKENDAVVSYQENDKTKYFKIENILEKETEFYPITPPRN